MHGRSKGLSHSDAVRTIVPDTSPGFPANYNGFTDKRSVVEMHSQDLAAFYEVCQDYSCIKAVSLKDELRPMEKVREKKTRIFIISPVEHLYVCSRVFGEFVDWFYTTHNSPSKIGVSPFHGDWHSKMSEILDFSPYLFDTDIKGMDISQRADTHDIILEFILDFLDPHLHPRAIWCYEEAIFGYTISQHGLVFRTAGENPSGWLLTAVVNTLYMYLLLCAAFFDHYGYDDEAFAMWFEKVSPGIFGDDNICAVDETIAHDWHPSLIKQRLSTYVEVEGSDWFKPPDGVVFLQAYSRKIHGVWVPQYLNQKCWDSLAFVRKGLDPIQKLSKYCSLITVYWWQDEFRSYLQSKIRDFVKTYHELFYGDPSWDALVLEAVRDHTPDFFPVGHRMQQSRVALNHSPIKRRNPMSSITQFDNQAKKLLKDADKQIKKQEKRANPEAESLKKFKRKFKSVFGRGSHDLLKAHSAYYRSLIDPWNAVGAKVPNAYSFTPTGTCQVVQSYLLNGLGPNNTLGIWVRPSMVEGIRTLSYAAPNYGWGSTANNFSAYATLASVCNSIKAVSLGLSIEFEGTYQENGGEFLFAYIPGKQSTTRDNFISPTAWTGTDPYSQALDLPYRRTMPVNSRGGLITWRPTDFDSLNFYPIDSPDVNLGGTIIDPLGSVLVMATALNNTAVKFRVNVVINFEVVPKTASVNFFNMTPAISDSMEMDLVTRHMQDVIVPVSRNLSKVEGVTNQPTGTVHMHHEHDNQTISDSLSQFLLPLASGIEAAVDQL